MWYKEAVFYEVYVRAFCDSNGDGIGDIPGLTSRLDYLSSLGVNCLWLLPINPSPLKDDGYDVSDYYNIHPDYGTLEDFKTLVKAIHERNMRIIIDIVMNHTSDQHLWFQQGRSDPSSKYRDYYVWSSDVTRYKDARIIFLDTEKSNWSWDAQAGMYYWHRFYSSQPDLNYDNPAVVEEMLSVLKFWLDLGIDGFRCDAVPYLFEREGTNCENLPETHTFLKQIRKVMDTDYPGRVLLAEACQLPHEVREYFGEGDEFHMGFHFPIMPRIFMSLKAEDYSSLKGILDETPEIPPTCQWVTFLRNHDELTLEMVLPHERQWMWEKYAPHPRMRLNLGIRRRLSPLLDNDRRKIEIVHSMLLTLPGSPILYYGDEIGMGDNIWLPDRNGVRTPMQWDADLLHNAGFSCRTGSIYSPLITDPEYNPEKVNVKDAEKDPSSLYNILRHMIGRRRSHSAAFGNGHLVWLDTDDKAVAAWLRTWGLDTMLVIHNLANQKKSLKIRVPHHYLSHHCCHGVNVINDTKYPLRHGSLHVELEAYDYLWIDLESESNKASYHYEHPSLSLVHPK